MRAHQQPNMKLSRPRVGRHCFWIDYTASSPTLGTEAGIPLPSLLFNQVSGYRRRVMDDASTCFGAWGEG